MSFGDCRVCDRALVPRRLPGDDPSYEIVCPSGHPQELTMHWTVPDGLEKYAVLLQLLSTHLDVREQQENRQRG